MRYKIRRKGRQGGDGLASRIKFCLGRLEGAWEGAVESLHPMTSGLAGTTPIRWTGSKGRPRARLKRAASRLGLNIIVPEKSDEIYLISMIISQFLGLLSVSHRSKVVCDQTPSHDTASRFRIFGAPIQFNSNVFLCLCPQQRGPYCTPTALADFACMLSQQRQRIYDSPLHPGRAM